MVVKTLNEIVELAKANMDEKRRMVVASAADDHTLEAVIRVERESLIEPILIGDAKKILTLLSEMNADGSRFRIVDAEADDSPKIAVELIRNNEADFLMKGNVATPILMKAVLNKENGLLQGSLLSHVLYVQLPLYPKLLVITDSAIVANPDLEQKKGILLNAVNCMHDFGYSNPKVAVLCANEDVNPKKQETVDAAALQAMNESGEISGCIVAGPISTDIAFDKSAAAVKGYDNPVVGDPDILLMPSVLAGNIAVKLLRCFGKSMVAGTVVGAQVPIVLNSRSSSEQNKYMSIALCAAMAKRRG